MTDSSPPVLSFPAILRNAGLTSRFAHLHDTLPSNDASKQATTQDRRRIREQNEGKRWIRRKDNGSDLSKTLLHYLISSVFQPASSEILTLLPQRNAIIHCLFHRLNLHFQSPCHLIFRAL